MQFDSRVQFDIHCRSYHFLQSFAVFGKVFHCLQNVEKPLNNLDHSLSLRPDNDMWSLNPLKAVAQVYRMESSHNVVPSQKVPSMMT